jgi:hypothetical protein
MSAGDSRIFHASFKEELSEEERKGNETTGGRGEEHVTLTGSWMPGQEIRGGEVTPLTNQ